MATALRQTSYASILCPVDFSEHSGVALRYAAALAKRAQGSLHVLFVNDPLLVAAAAAAYNKQTLGETSATELRRFVRAALRGRATHGLSLTCETAIGKPAAEILRATRRLAPDLVVLGTKGLGVAERLLLGSTTTTVLRKATVPVLAVPPLTAAKSEGLPTRRWPGAELLVPVDIGTHTASDLMRAADVARRFKASLHVLHAVPSPSLPAWLKVEGDADARARHATAQSTLSRLLATLGDVDATLDVRMGEPAAQIAAVAAERHAGLIVMTLRGGGGWFGARAGRVAYRVLCHGVAPVLALPTSHTSARQR